MIFPPFLVRLPEHNIGQQSNSWHLCVFPSFDLILLVEFCFDSLQDQKPRSCNNITGPVCSSWKNNGNGHHVVEFPSICSCYCNHTIVLHSNLQSSIADNWLLVYGHGALLHLWQMHQTRSSVTKVGLRLPYTDTLLSPSVRKWMSIWDSLLRSGHEHFMQVQVRTRYTRIHGKYRRVFEWMLRSEIHVFSYFWHRRFLSIHKQRHMYALPHTIYKHTYIHCTHTIYIHTYINSWENTSYRSIFL